MYISLVIFLDNQKKEGFTFICIFSCKTFTKQVSLTTKGSKCGLKYGNILTCLSTVYMYVCFRIFQQKKERGFKTPTICWKQGSIAVVRNLCVKCTEDSEHLACKTSWNILWKLWPLLWNLTLTEPQNIYEVIVIKGNLLIYVCLFNPILGRWRFRP